jgi:luciferase family oxidoreductase group 1
MRPGPFRNSLDLAQHAERWNYKRFWLAEHHNMPGIASAATAVVIGYIAGGTGTIRVGSGGVMLPNHAPLVIAEQFGTLESLYRGRIDLGLGRAPGTDQPTARALRRDLATTAENFPHDVMELQALLAPLPPTRWCGRCQVRDYGSRSGCSDRARSVRSSLRCSVCRLRSRRILPLRS